jgi:predicted transcriptional regulator
MPKIDAILGEYELPPLQQRVLSYFQEHKDEIFSYMDAKELAKLIKHNGSPRGVAFALWALDKKGVVDKERVGKRVYFGSKEAITELRKKKKK